MVPFVELPTLRLGPIAVDPFSTLVVIGVLVGVVVARRRCVTTGLDPIFGERLMWHAIGIGFVLSHVLDVLAYHPEQVLEDPLVLLRVWGSQSSFAGMLGGLLGMAFFFARHGGHLDLRERLAYVDTIAYGFPFAWIFGRLGCTFALDHPGALTSFPLGTSLATASARAFLRSVYAEAGRLADLPGDETLARLGFHNLGFYELLYTVGVIVPAMLLLGRKPRTPGFFLAAFLLLYAPIRFVADFLRVGDRTYAGLTFGQYAALALTFAAAYLVHRTRHASR
ncbi:MAG: prolipoprotein diacylglyceryl transferase family protein [Polyangiales bacterium]